MSINNITQTISTLPPAGKRGVDVQTQFVIKQEDFQDHLQGTTVTELNTLKDQFNSRISEINSTATTMNGYANTASAGASTATTKAGEASTSAGEALTYKNQAETFKNNASASATKASQWSDNNYNVEVEAGKYSAKHWSTVAQNTVNNKINKVTSTNNAIPKFNGTSGDIQNSNILIDSSGNLNITGTGKRITGDFSNATLSNLLMFQTNVANSATNVSLIPSGTSSISALRIFNTADANNSSWGALRVSSTDVGLYSAANGTGNYLPMLLHTGGTERMRIDASGNVLLTSATGGLGYGAGAGGTVTQLTSKSTTVTLNKPSGTIIMNNSALAAGASVTFTLVNNLLFVSGDNLLLTINNPISGYNYKADVAGMLSGIGAQIRVTNVSGSTLSDALSLDFAVIKGANS